MTSKISKENVAREEKLSKKLSSIIIASKSIGYLKYWDKKMDKFKDILLEPLELTEAEYRIAHALIMIDISMLLIDRWCIPMNKETSAINFNTFEKTMYVLKRHYAWEDMQRLVRYLAYKYDHYTEIQNGQRDEDDPIDDNEYSHALMQWLITLNTEVHKDTFMPNFGIRKLTHMENILTDYLTSNHMVNHHVNVGAYRIKRLSREFEKWNKKGDTECQEDI